MISDEMRELLSAYVDDELRPQDAARVEELCKRDPELRTEIEDYRRLRGKLKAWDAENRLAPSPTLLRRAVDRARTHLMEQRAAAKGRVLRLAFHPAALAAGLLLAVCLGLLAARPEASAPAEFASFDVGPLAPAPDLTVKADLAPEPPLPRYEASPAYDYVEPRLLGRWVDGVVMSDLAIRFLEEKETEITKWATRKRAREMEAVRADPERRTGAWNRQVLDMLDPYRPGAEPVAGMVTLRRPEDPGLPRFAAMPEAAPNAHDQDREDRIYVSVAEDPRRSLLPLGEVWMGVKDKSGRTRVVATSHLVFDSEFVSVAWADDRKPGASDEKLEVAPFILGPEARRMAAAAKGPSPEFLAWLKARYGASLADAFARGAPAREKEVRALATALAADRDATGFAVVDKDGKVLGMELFASHHLMMEFAPRLLHGYLVEAGDAIRLERPADGALSQRFGIAVRALGDVAGKTATVEVLVDRGTRAGWPESLGGLRQVNLRNAAGAIIGHGIVHGDRPIHLTVFE